MARVYRHLEGMAQLQAQLDLLPREVRVTVLASGVRAATRPLVIYQKRYAKRSERTGALRQSITAKVVNYKESARAVAIVGPNRRYFAKGKIIGKGQLITVGAVRPANYAHLIEFGHHAVEPRKGTTIRKGTARLAKKSWVPARPFIRPAVIAARGAMAAGFDTGVTRGIERSIKKIKSSVSAI